MPIQNLPETTIQSKNSIFTKHSSRLHPNAPNILSPIQTLLFRVVANHATRKFFPNQLRNRTESDLNIRTAATNHTNRATIKRRHQLSIRRVQEVPLQLLVRVVWFTADRMAEQPGTVYWHSQLSYISRIHSDGETISLQWITIHLHTLY